MADIQTTIQDELQKRLLASTGVISSETTDIDKLITESISGLEKGQESRGKGIAASYERQRLETGETGARTLTSAEEARRGFGTNTALIKQIKESTEKSLRDLDLREQEALASGQVETAGQIAGLKINQLQFGIQAEQQAFSNLLAGAGLQMQQKQLDQAKNQFEANLRFQENQFSFQKEAKMAELALEKDKFKFSKALNEIEAQQTEINLDRQLTDSIVNQGLDPISAANQALAVSRDLGIKVTKDEYNKTVEKAQEIAEKWRLEQDKTSAESAGGMFGIFKSLFSGSGEAIERKPRISVSEGFRKLKESQESGFKFGDQSLNFFNNLFEQ